VCSQKTAINPLFPLKTLGVACAPPRPERKRKSQTLRKKRAKKKCLKSQKINVMAKSYGSHEVIECVLVMLLYTALFTFHQKPIRATNKRGILQG
jgi:hypothetical protein